jgi:bacteriorhodopsin
MDTLKKQEIDNKVNSNIKVSFTLTYILLLTTGTITLIEALRTKNPIVRHIFNLETVISIIAGYFYSMFTSLIEKHEEKNIPINWHEINKLRYIDWSITTPIMLLVLCVALSEHSEVKLNFLIYIGIIFLNFTMLFLGYLGETNKINKNLAMTTSFIAFLTMFVIIYINFVQPKYSLFNYILFSFFFVIWSIYGLIYKLREDYRVISYNVLDLVAKCFVGIGLWVYFAELFK